MFSLARFHAKLWCDLLLRATRGPPLPNIWVGLAPLPNTGSTLYADPEDVATAMEAAGERARACVGERVGAGGSASGWRAKVGESESG